MNQKKEVYSVVDHDEMKNFIFNCLKSAGMHENHSEQLAKVLIAADHCGHYSHGLNRIELYLDEIQRKAVRDDCEPVILKENACTAWVNGQNLCGPVVGSFCMNLAIEKAKKAGVGWVVCNGSNHFGIAGYYSKLASDEKLIGMSFTNGSPLVVSTGGKHPFLSTNPLSLSAQGDRETFLLDMATSAVSYGKVEIQDRKNAEMPPTWAVNNQGKSTTNPKEFHALLPLGGFVETSGYKGFGLGVMVEILAALLSGSAVQPNVRNWKDRSSNANLGQCFIAVDPSCFAPGFEQRLDQLASDIRSQEPADENIKVQFPGDMEMNRIKECTSHFKGIPYHKNQILFADKLAKKWNLKPPQVIGEVEI